MKSLTLLLIIFFSLSVLSQNKEANKMDNYNKAENNVLLVGKLLKNIPDTSKVTSKNIKLFSASDLTEVENVFQQHNNNIDIVIIGAGIDLEERMKIVRYVLTANDKLTVHLKDKLSGSEGFLPFINNVLNGLINMNTKKLFAEKSIELSATVSKVWKAITTNENVEAFMLGMKPQTDWKVGSNINWIGRHEGEEHNMAKGKITQLIPEKLLEYTFFYGGYGHADVPQHYQTVRFELSKMNEHATQLKIQQGDYLVFEDGETYLQHAKDFWEKAAQKLKEVCEK